METCHPSGYAVRLSTTSRPPPFPSRTGCLQMMWHTAGSSRTDAHLLISPQITFAIIMSDLKGALKTVIAFFYKYAKQDGDAYSITKKELKVLLKQELKMEHEGPDGEERLDDFFKGLDDNEDNVVDFDEFCDLFVTLLKKRYGFAMLR
ncbi:ictacalcin-like isoform X2 [Sparus aurata]|uniref:ictacalcin-like isoform X2 n=1 Tax=Sparus aurata TaxID=8175 RepID=UPI0011C10E86|nr:ictacalcin-like isoform X2 [Sparus aurata]